VQKKEEARSVLHDWPMPPPRQWLATVNRPQSESELTALRRSVNRGTPFGTDRWQTRTAQTLGLEWTLRTRESRRFSSAKELRPLLFADPFIRRTFPNAKVTWSFEYGATPESRKAGLQGLQKAADDLRQ
jgi:hypothetical protein